MQLRAHPLMNYRGLSNWPPVWSRVNDPERSNKLSSELSGEIGILKTLDMGYLAPGAICCLRIEFEKADWMGVLLFDNRVFCQQIHKLLQQYIGHSIKEIGDIDLSSATER